MRWRSGQEFVRPVYTPLSGPNVHLLEQADRVSNTTPEPGINGSPKIPHKPSVRMLIISTCLVTITETCIHLYNSVISSSSLLISVISHICIAFFVRHCIRIHSYNITLPVKISIIVALDPINCTERVWIVDLGTV